MSPHSDITESMRVQADAWWTQLHSGKATQSDARAFQQWLAQDPAHHQAWRELNAGVRKATPALREAMLRHPEWADLSVLSASKPPLSRRAFLGGALAASVAGGAVLAWRPPLGLWPSVAEFAADFRTEVGEQREIRIDQTVAVQMNTRTYINRLDSASGPRIELLTGEAEVHVAASATAPLTVQAGSGSMQAQAAQFNVRYTGPRVMVTCLFGQVWVRAAQAMALQAGQQMIYDSQRVLAVQQANLEQVSNWRQGYIAFENAPLAEVVDEINRYRPGKILLRSDALAERTVRLRLAIRDMDLAVDMLRTIPGVQVQELAGGIALLRQA